jgi:hypothetical protein
MSSVSEQVKRNATMGKPGSMVQAWAVCPACMSVQDHEHLAKGIGADGQVMACQKCGRSSHATAFLVLAQNVGLAPTMQTQLAEAIDVLNQLGSCDDLVQRLRALLRGHA